MPHPDNIYHERVVRLSQLAGEQGTIESCEFTGCDIKGPAVIVIQGQSTISNCTFEGNMDAMLWELPPHRQAVIGALLVSNCTFEGCTFTNVGFAGPPDFIESFKGGTGG